MHLFTERRFLFEFHIRMAKTANNRFHFERSTKARSSLHPCEGANGQALFKIGEELITGQPKLRRAKALLLAKQWSDKLEE